MVLSTCCVVFLGNFHCPSDDGAARARPAARRRDARRRVLLTRRANIRPDDPTKGRLHRLSARMVSFGGDTSRERVRNCAKSSNNSFCLFKLFVFVSLRRAASLVRRSEVVILFRSDDRLP